MRQHGHCDKLYNNEFYAIHNYGENTHHSYRGYLYSF